MSSTAIAEREDGLLERTRSLLPLLRENAPRCEQARRVVAENIEALTDAGVFRMTVGRHFGGYESSVATQFEVLAEIASACPSTSWVATILTAMIWNVGMFPDEAQEEVFADPRVRVASVFAPGGQARQVDGGVVVSGRWPFNTGCQNSQWAILTAIVSGDTGEPAPASLLIPYTELVILDDWDATGMAGTGSNTTVADEVFVPAHRLLPLAAAMGLDMSDLSAGGVVAAAVARAVLEAAQQGPAAVARHTEHGGDEALRHGWRRQSTAADRGPRRHREWSARSRRRGLDQTTLRARLPQESFTRPHPSAIARGRRWDSNP